MQLPLSLIHYPEIDPVIFHLGPIAIRWYGMAYLTAFLIAYFVLIYLSRGNVMRMPAAWISDMVGWLALGVVAGGRIGWWIFYHRPAEHPEPIWEPIAIWHGGMSFHGGLAGVMVVLWIWCREKKLSFLNLADSLALVTPIGLCLGRIANFINAELYGRGPTSVAWAMIFPHYVNGQWVIDPSQIPRHPSQLYEAILEGPVLLAVVWAVKKFRGRRDGQIAATFVIFYAIFRFAVEFTRQPDEQLGTFTLWVKYGITMGQTLSAGIGLAGVVWLIALHKYSTRAFDAERRAFDVQPANPPQKNTPKEKRAG